MVELDRFEPVRGKASGLVPKMVAHLLHPVAVLVVLGHLSLLAFGWWSLQHIIPDTLTLRAFGHEHTVFEVHRRIIDRAVEIGFLVPSVFLLEYLWMGWRESSVRHLLFERTASARSDIVCFLFGLAPAWTIVSAIMSFGVVYISAGWLKHRFAAATGVHFHIAAMPLALQMAALFFVYTFFDYWSHRLDHTKLMWPLHRFHHSAESFSVLTAARIHPAVFTAVVTTTLPGVLLGPSKAAFVEVGLMLTLIRLLVHSRIDSDFGWFGRWVLISPMHHRLHHSFNRMPFNSGMIPIWDRLFGTWREIPVQPMRMGTVTPYQHGAWIGPDIWRDYLEFWGGVVSGARKWLHGERPRPYLPR